MSQMPNAFAFGTMVHAVHLLCCWFDRLLPVCRAVFPTCLPAMSPPYKSHKPEMWCSSLLTYLC